MSEEQSFEELLNQSFKTIRNGEVVEGTVIDVKPEQAYLNIGYKADGVLTREEYSNDAKDLTEVLKTGDKLEVKVLKVNDGDGQVVLTYKRLAAEKGNKRLEEAFNNREVLTAKVSQVLKGGLTVLVEDTRVFIPASLVDRRQILTERKAEAAKELFARINKGDIVEGTVKNVTDFGAFVDLGGADGLLHISEMSWGRVENPKKLFHNGQELTVLIKDIKGEKIALSLKFPDQNPWIEAAENFGQGSIVTGHVARMTDFGAFVELLPGVDALLHVSQISRDHVDKPSDVLKIGQEIEAKVVDFNAEDHKISLSIKALEMDRQQNDDTVYTDEEDDYAE